MGNGSSPTRSSRTEGFVGVSRFKAASDVSFLTRALIIQLG